MIDSEPMNALTAIPCFRESVFPMKSKGIRNPAGREERPTDGTTRLVMDQAPTAAKVENDGVATDVTHTVH